MNFGATMYFTDYSMSPSERQIVRKNVDTHENGKLNRVHFENRGYIGLQSENALVRGASSPDCQTTVSRDRPEIWGIMRLWQRPGRHWRSGQIDAQTQHRACRCRPRTEPGAADRHQFATIASAGTCSCAG